MRPFLLGLCLGLQILYSTFALTQSGKQTILIGTDLTLGMSEDTALRQITKTGHTLRKEEPPDSLRKEGVTSMWLVDADKPSVGSICFSAGKLTHAVKSLLPDDGNEVDFGKHLYFALRDLEAAGYSHCIIETENREVPDFALKMATLKCGDKSIVVNVQKFEKRPESVQLQEELNAH